MAFKIGPSCLKEVIKYLEANNNGSGVTINIEPGENKLLIKFLDKLDIESIITVHRDDNNGNPVGFPTVTKTGRLGDKL